MDDDTKTHSLYILLWNYRLGAGYPGEADEKRFLDLEKNVEYNIHTGTWKLTEPGQRYIKKLMSI